VQDDRANLLIGAGGHAAGVVDVLARSGYRLSAYVDAVRADWLSPYGDPVQYEDDAAAIAAFGAATARVFVGLGGVSPRALKRRLEIFYRYEAAGFDAPKICHPDTTIAASAAVESGATLLARAVVQPFAEIGKGAIVNTGAIVEHHATIGAGAHIAPGAVVLGGASIGDCALVGANAVVLPQAVVADGDVVPAGARFQ